MCLLTKKINSSDSARRTLQFGIICFALLIHFAAQSADQKNSANENCQLSVNFAEWRPYQYFDENNNPTGLQYELISKIAQEARCKVHFIPINFEQALAAIERGDIDMMINASLTQARQKFAHYSVSYRTEMLMLYAKPEFLAECKSKSIADLIETGFRLGLQKSSIYGDEIRELQSNPTSNNKLTYFDNISQNYQMVLDDKIDGIVDDPMIVAYQLRKSRIEGRLVSCDKTAYSSDLYIMFSKKNVPVTLVERFNQAIQVVKQSQFYQSHWEWP